MDFIVCTFRIFLFLKLVACVDAKAIDNLDYDFEEDEHWLADKENYDSSMDYLGDQVSGVKLQSEEKCPPLPEIMTSSACMATPCGSDSDCGGAEGRCCDNGCVFTCFSYPIGPTYIDWVREPKRRQRNGISWLVKGPNHMEELQSCSTTQYKDEDPLLCPTGYICHVETPGDMKKDIPNLGHCVPDKDVVVSSKSTSISNFEDICYLDKYILVNGASIEFKKETCYCKHGFLTCLQNG